MIIIDTTPERIHIQNTTFEKEYGEVVKYTDKYVVVRLFHRGCEHFPEDTSFIRNFSKKTGKAHGMNLRILP